MRNKALNTTICVLFLLILTISVSLIVEELVITPYLEESDFTELREKTNTETKIKKKDVESIDEKFIKEALIDIDTAVSDETSKKESYTKETVYTDYSVYENNDNINYIPYDYDSLSKINSDIVGWITIPNTAVDYPVMQTDKGNSYYLCHNYKKEDVRYGSIVMDYRCNSISDNIILYGHNMSSGNMFAFVKWYKEESTFKYNPYIYFTYNGEIHKYLIFTAFETHTVTDNKFNYLLTKITDDFIDKAISLSYYNTGITADSDDSILTLSTCSDATSDLRNVIMAKKIS